MKEFNYKIYRCEWQIVSQPVGQYFEDNGLPIVLSSWPTREEAVLDRPNWAIESKYVVDRWFPHDNNNGYNIVEIRYCEVAVPYIPGK